MNCTWQLAHQEMTPVFPSASLSSELVATRPDTSVSPRAQLDHAAAMGRPAHDFIGDAERIHDVERGERHVRGLEHIAAGVEHEIRPLARLCGRAILQALVYVLAEARRVRSHRAACARAHSPRRQPAENSRSPCLRRSRRSDACLAMATRAIASRKRGLTPSSHAAMQSPVSAQPLAQAFDAVGPSPVRTISSTPAITLSGVGVANAGRLRHRADFNAFAAARAGFEHLGRARCESGFKSGFGH